MNLKPEYHLHGQEKTWLKATTVEKIAQSASLEALFYYQELPTGEGRVCFNTDLANKNGFSLLQIQDVFEKVKKEDAKKYTSNKFKTTNAYFKDAKNNNMVFDDAINQMFAKRLWTYSSDLKDGKVVNISAAPFINKDSAKALLNLIKNNLPNIIKEYEVEFSPIKDKLNKTSPDFFENSSLKSKLVNVRQQINQNNQENSFSYSLPKQKI